MINPLQKKFHNCIFTILNLNILLFIKFRSFVMYIRLFKNMFHAPIFGFFYIWVSIFDKLKFISRLSFCQKSGIFTLHRSSFDKHLNSFDAYSSLLFASEASYILYVPLAYASPVWFAQLHWLFPDYSIHKHAFLRFWDCLTSSFNKRLKSSSPRAPNVVFLELFNQMLRVFRNFWVRFCAFNTSIAHVFVQAMLYCGHIGSRLLYCAIVTLVFRQSRFPIADNAIYACLWRRKFLKLVCRQV